MIYYRLGGSALNATDRSSTSNRMAEDSCEKLQEILELASSLGVFVGPVRFYCKPDPSSITKVSAVEAALPSVSIFPLYSWYHSGWDTEPDVTHPESVRMEQAIPFQTRWGDFTFCSWPSHIVPADEDITDLKRNSLTLPLAFAALNEPFLPSEEGNSKQVDYLKDPLLRDKEAVISFSHFVPRVELSPEKRFLIDPKLAAVIGSDPLEEQIRRLLPDLHLFGHTHIPIDLTIDGITYIQWPLGYHR